MDNFIKYNIDCPAGVLRAALEDSIMHEGYEATAGSKMLEGFIAPFDATVVERIEAAGIKIVGKTKMPEFGIAGLLTCAEGLNLRNPGTAPASDTESRDTSLTPGAVTAVAEDAADFALCNDYTGLTGQYAAANGLYYIHPAYGTVSRYGLIPLVSSMDQIGIVCKNLEDGFRILSIISGADPRDGAMFKDQESGATQRIEDGGQRTKDAMDIELKYLDLCTPVMQILCFAELSANISRYDAIKFGYRAEEFAGLQELYTKSRTEGFGTDAKLAAIMGAMVLSHENYTRYYDKAMRLRRLIKESLEFDKYDAIIVPNAKPGEDPQPGFRYLPRLCGLPAITTPPTAGDHTIIATATLKDALALLIMS